MKRNLFSFLILTIVVFFIFVGLSSKTSAEDKMELMPLTEVSSKDRVEINPQAENPVLINKEPLEVEEQQTGKMPMISIDIQTPENTGKSPLKSSTGTISKQPLQIGINQETQEVVIERGETVVKTKEPINVENNNLAVQTPEGKMPINVLPDTITKMVIQEQPQKLEEINLKVVDKQPIYEAKGLKEEKVLNIIPVKMPIQTKISAQTGEIIGVEKPWWVKILDSISF